MDLFHEHIHEDIVFPCCRILRKFGVGTLAGATSTCPSTNFIFGFDSDQLLVRKMVLVDMLSAQASRTSAFWEASTYSSMRTTGRREGER